MSCCVLKEIREEEIKEFILPILLNTNNSVIKEKNNIDIETTRKRIVGDIFNEEEIIKDNNKIKNTQIPIIKRQIESKEKECISYFMIKNRDVIPFDFTNEDDGIEVINKVKNIDPIIDFLKDSNNLDKDIYLKILETFRKKLSKVISNMEDEVENTIDEETCENWTNDFFSIVEDFLIDKVMVSIYRTLINKYEDKTTFTFFSNFLSKLNNYLDENGVYTYEVYPNEKLKDSDYDYVNLTTNKADSKIDHNLIKEVEKLPYIMDYKNEYSEKECLNSKGKVYVLSFNG